MEKTWRWFGPSDPITLEMLRQIGVEGIVTALHHVPNGEVWTREEVGKRRRFIEERGLRWSVVESLPVSESIKYGGADRGELIERYKESLANLGREGVRTVCYNFMPVLDWARTELEHPLPDGTSCLYFNKAEFAYFDIYILQRTGAREAYESDVLRKADALAETMTEEGRHRLVDNIIVRTQGFVNGNISADDEQPVEKFRHLLSLYEGITAEQLRHNLQTFLEEIMPVCDEWGIDMCIHPDDPPMPILGLPRIVTCEADIERLLSMVPNQHNGLTFCAGSLSAGEHNDVQTLARRFASRTHFVHLRSCQTLPGGDFIEASHLGGRANLVELCRIFMAEGRRLPMRVDHAPLMLGDETRGYNAGYSFHGRMLALGQVSGMMAAVKELTT